jgi:hypothetical protein
MAEQLRETIPGLGHHRSLGTAAWLDTNLSGHAPSTVDFLWKVAEASRKTVAEEGSDL